LAPLAGYSGSDGTGKLAVAYEAARCHARAAFCIIGPRRARPCAGADRPAHEQPGAAGRMGGLPATRQTVVPRADLRWRAQSAPEPARGFFGFHRIAQRDRGLVNAIASGAFEYSDVKVRGGTGFDPCQQHHCFALWTWRPVKRDHDASPSDQAGALHNSQSPRCQLRGGDVEQPSTPVPRHLVNTDHLSK
jgi:hypothetical protein